MLLNECNWSSIACFITLNEQDIVDFCQKCSALSTISIQSVKVSSNSWNVSQTFRRIFNFPLAFIDSENYLSDDGNDEINLTNKCFKNSETRFSVHLSPKVKNKIKFKLQKKINGFYQLKLGNPRGFLETQLDFLLDFLWISSLLRNPCRPLGLGHSGSGI